MLGHSLAGEAAAQVTAVSADCVDMPNTPRRVLVAEDSATQRAVCVNVLRDAGLEVHEAPDGRYALDICRIIRPDVVVLDLMLPRLNGFELLRKLRADRKISQTQVIIVTADDSQATADAVFYEGANDLVTKPVDAGDLIARVQEALSAAAAAAAA
jgi:PleD family two-component response regulator